MKIKLATSLASISGVQLLKTFIDYREEEEKAGTEDKKDADEATANQELEQQAGSELFNEFVTAGVKEANIKVESVLGQPSLKKYEQKEGDWPLTSFLIMF